MNKAKYWLRMLFGLGGFALSTAFIPLFIPVDLMDSIHSALGLGEFPKGPIVEYLARSTTAFYAAHGVIMLLIFFRIDKYWSFIPVICCVHIGLGVVLLATDISASMPLYWTLAEGVPVIGFGALLLVLFQKANKVEVVQ